MKRSIVLSMCIVSILTFTRVQATDSVSVLYRLSDESSLAEGMVEMAAMPQVAEPESPIRLCRS